MTKRVICIYTTQHTTCVSTMDDRKPIGIANVGNSCFLNSLVQCLCVPAIAKSIQDRLSKSEDALDVLVYSAAVHSQRAQLESTKIGRDFGRHHRGAHIGSASSSNMPYDWDANNALQLATPLIRELFDTELGLQGQQCPLQFFGAACKQSGVLAACFNATIGEVLKCGECGARLKEPCSWSDNHVQILKFDHNTAAITLKSLILENVISSPIEDYSPVLHPHLHNSAEMCSGAHGAFHVTYFSQEMPGQLCFALSSRTAGLCKDTRYFAPEHTMQLPEIVCSPENSSVFECPRVANYELYATITHSGQSSQGGHFSAYVLRGTSSWFHCDDEHVTAVDAAIVIDPPAHQSIYMLFFRRIHSTCNQMKRKRWVE